MPAGRVPCRDDDRKGVMKRWQRVDWGASALTVVLFALTLILFTPLTVWVVRQTLFHEQLTHALVILGLASAALLMEERPRLHFYGGFDRWSTGCLLASFLMLAAGTFLRSPVLLLPSYGLAGAAWGLYVFGPGLRRAVFSLAAGFIGYVLLAAAVTALDWPLRAMAGRYAQWVLDKLGFFTEIGFAGGDPPKLILVVDGRPFEVAAECNGFGLIGASLLLALLLVVYRRFPWVDRLICLAVAGMLATSFNILRIITICILAPTFPDHYWAMHEVVGNVYFWICLALVWGAVRWLQHEPDARKIA
jgi:exosortase/archaeosortase family protein